MHEIFSALLLTSLSMSAVILLIMLLNKLLQGKLTATFRYYMWLVVLVALLIPFKPSLPIPVMPFQIIPQIETVDVAGVFREQNSSLKQAMSQQTGFADEDGIEYSVEDGAKGSDEYNIEDSSKGGIEYSYNPENISIPLIFVLFCIWIAGLLIKLAVHFLSYGRFSSTLRKITPESGTSRILHMQAVLTEMGLQHKKIALKSSPLISSPMMIGFFHPTILLPDDEICPDELDYIIRHELTHYKRKDLWMNLLILLASAIHWFNPIVVIMAKFIRMDCEMACDETVVAGRNDEQRKQYGETIIGFIGKRDAKTPVLSVLTTNFFGGGNIMKKRLSVILDTKRKSKWLSALCITVVMLLTIISGNVFAYSANASGTKISARQAMDVVLDFLPNCEIDSMQNGGSAYQFSVIDAGQRYIVKVNALSGEIDSFALEEATKSATQSATTYAKTPSPSAPSATTPSTTTAPSLKIQQPAPANQQFYQMTGVIGTDEARAIAVDYLGQGSVIRHETKKDHYKICIHVGNEHHDIKINFNGTFREHTSREITCTSNKAFGYGTSGVIGFERAAALAIEKAGGGVIIKNELTHKPREGLVYKVDVVEGQTEHKLELFAANGYTHKYHTKYSS